MILSLLSQSVKLRSLLLAINFLPALSVFCQVREIRNAPSPEVANLGTFGSIPVGLYTGTPNISVPLYTMSVGNLSIPIEAIYHTSNVKPHTPPSSLGIGWVLSSGGYIARNVKGVQDEKEAAYGMPGYYFNHGKIGTIENSSDKAAMLKQQTKLSGNGWFELSADEFTFSFNGYSGSFFMDKDGYWRVVSDDNIRVEFDEVTGFKSITDLGKRFSLQYYNKNSNKRFFDKFTLVTPDGTRYEFGGDNATEYSVPYYNQVKGDIMATCWRLSKITTIDKRIIRLDYAADSYMCDIHYAPQMMKFFKSKNDSVGQYNFGRTAYTGFLTMPSRLMKISSEDETITFSYERDNAYGDLFLANTGCLYWQKKSGYYDENVRYMYASKEDVFDKHKFSLFTGVEPLESEQVTREAIAKKITHDYLRNITIRKSKIKVLSLNFDYQLVQKRQLLSSIKFMKDDKQYIHFSSANNINKMATNTSPENVLVKPYDSDKSVIGGSINTPKEIKEFEYKFEYYLNSDVTKQWPNRNPLTFTDSWGYYSRSGFNPENLGEWQMSMIYTNNDFIIRTPLLPSTKEFTLKTIIYPTGGRTNFEYELNDYSKEFDIQTYSIRDKSASSGGLRIKTISNYDISGALLYTKDYIYNNTIGGKSSGISKGRPCFYDRIYFNEKQSKYLDFYSFDNMLAYPLNFNTPDVGYSTVFEELRDGDGNLMSRTKYQYTNYDADTNNQTHFAKPADYTANVYGSYASASFTSMAFERGKLVEKEVMDARGKLMERASYEYVRSTGEPYSTVAQEYHLDANLNLFGYSYMYKTFANRYLVSTKREQEMLTNGTFERTCQYKYNALGLLSEEKVTTANGETETTSYKYTFEGHDSARFVAKNILMPLTNVKRKNKSGQNEVLTYAWTVDTVPYVSKKETILSVNDATDTHEDYRVEKTDKYGNPIVYVENGITTIMIWSHYGQKVVASIQNASYDDVAKVLDCSIEDFSSMSRPTISIDILREKLPNAFVYTYEYDYMLNLMYKTDPKGMRNWYRYDPLGRLTEVYRMHNGKMEILNTYDYNYQTK